MKKIHLIIAGMFVVLLLSVLGIVIMSSQNKEEETKKDPTTFSVFTDAKVFQSVPRMEGENISITDARDIGDGSYMLFGENTTFEEYKAYLALLEEKGYDHSQARGTLWLQNNVPKHSYLFRQYPKNNMYLYVALFN